MSWRHILFAIGAGEEIAPGVLRKLANLAKSLDAEVECFDCAFEFAAVDDQKIREIVKRRRDELDHTVSSLREAGVRARSSVRWDYPTRDGILRHVRRVRPALLVILAARHSRIGRWLLTYTDYKLIENCPCPLLLIKNDLAYEDLRVIAAIDPMQAHDKPSDLDAKILEVAATFARAVSAPLHVYHACSPWPKVGPDRRALRELPTAVYADICGAYQAKAEGRVRALSRLVDVPDERVHVVAGSAACLLPDFVRSNGSDVIVMGTVSRSAIRRMLIGHTAEKVLDTTNCDLLVVKPGRTPARVAAT